MKRIDIPLYESKPTKKSMNNKYDIYDDRIELKCRFPFITKTLVIKREDLISIETFKPPVIRTAFWALKLDLADFNEHVGIQRRNGIFKQLRLTPENPQEFVARVREIFKL
ncbi:MAG TPA: hypothetical protein PLT76_08755 [Candidatus Omnitrophota bacterium]|nr:hypothetical protein [Candidatus Omnitrophota bacterium]HQO58792.1 hypothetical protein [Candidatus Omnitrophota bacterium]HQP11367.1 hypothetical protein [Candidatus Omnitrophota bacterium]